MSSINRIEIQGHAGHTPELKSMTSGGSVCNLSLATTRVWKDKAGNLQESVQWHRVVCWNDLAKQVAEKVIKGTLVNITGRLEYRKYTDNNGAEKVSAHIIAHNFVVISTTTQV